MIPGSFEYFAPTALNEALSLLQEHGDDAKVLAGGHSLIPTMKLRLAEPAVIIDIGRIGGLKGISESDGKLVIGALTTHHELESSDLVQQRVPLLTQTAAEIGDVQVRNKGTIGGSIAHADPAADWPAAILALDADIQIAGPNGERTVKATDFFQGLYETDLGDDEILTAIHVSIPDANTKGNILEAAPGGIRICSRGCSSRFDQVWRYLPKRHGRYHRCFGCPVSGIGRRVGFDRSGADR